MRCAALLALTSVGAHRSARLEDVGSAPHAAHVPTATSFEPGGAVHEPVGVPKFAPGRRREPPEAPRLPGEWHRLQGPRLLGTGGFASVWRYRLSGCPEDAEVAVKAARLLGKDTTTLRMSMLREAQCEFALLRHFRGRGFIESYGGALDLQARKQLIAMEAADTDLAKLLRQDHSMDLPDLLTMLIQVMRAMEVMESEDLQHRDLKPSNILIKSDRSTGRLIVKVADLGLACHLRRDIGPCKRCSGNAGTKRYRAPESFGPAPYEYHRLDTWSLGLILYEIVLGTLPDALRQAKPPFVHHIVRNFTAQSDPHILKLRELGSAMSRELADLMVDMLSANPLGRPTIAIAKQRLESACEAGLTPVRESAMRPRGPSHFVTSAMLCGGVGERVQRRRSDVNAGTAKLLFFPLPPLVLTPMFNISASVFEGHVCCCLRQLVNGSPSARQHCKVLRLRSSTSSAMGLCATVSGGWVSAHLIPFGCWVDHADVFGYGD